LRCGGGGGRAVSKIYCTRRLKLATIPLYNPLKSPVGAHVHKTAYGFLIDMALYVMLLMWANSLLGQVGGVWALEISTFLGPKFHRAQKSLDFPPTYPHNGFARIKRIMYEAL
jgi:hypothetical protein